MSSSCPSVRSPSSPPVEWTRHGPSDGIDVPIPADVASGWPDGVPAGRPNWWDWAAGTTPTDLLRIEGQSAAAPSHGKQRSREKALGRANARPSAPHGFPTVPT
jgi:hypothetical protein